MVDKASLIKWHLSRDGTKLRSKIIMWNTAFKEETPSLLENSNEGSV